MTEIPNDVGQLLSQTHKREGEVPCSGDRPKFSRPTTETVGIALGANGDISGNLDVSKNIRKYIRYTVEIFGPISENWTGGLTNTH